MMNPPVVTTGDCKPRHEDLMGRSVAFAVSLYAASHMKCLQIPPKFTSRPELPELAEDQAERPPGPTCSGHRRSQCNGGRQGRNARVGISRRSFDQEVLCRGSADQTPEAV